MNSIRYSITVKLTTWIFFSEPGVSPGLFFEELIGHTVKPIHVNSVNFPMKNRTVLFQILFVQNCICCTHCIHIFLPHVIRWWCSFRSNPGRNPAVQEPCTVYVPCIDTKNTKDLNFILKKQTRRNGADCISFVPG